MEKKLFQPLGGNVMPRFGGPGTMMRLPSREDASGLDACFIGVPFDIGTSENAVRIQIAVALIAFLLLRLAQVAHKIIESPLAFARLVRANLMHRRRIDRLLHSEPAQQLDLNQLALQWT